MRQPTHVFKAAPMGPIVDLQMHQWLLAKQSGPIDASGGPRSGSIDAFRGPQSGAIDTVGGSQSGPIDSFSAPCSTRISTSKAFLRLK